MPLFQTGNPQQIRRKEDVLTPGAQKDSLTFLERGSPRPKFPTTTPDLTAMGLMLTGHSGVFFQPGATRRTAPRSQMSNRSGWEFQKPVAISGNQGTIELLYNPSLQLHRELAAVNLLEEYWRVVTFQAPPYMNCVAGEVTHLSASGSGLTAEDSDTMTVTVLDQFGASYVPGMLWSLKEREISSGNLVCTMEHVGESPRVGVSSGSLIDTTDKQLSVTPAGVFTFAHGASGTATGFQVALLVYSPGIGFALSTDQSAGFAASVSVTDAAFEDALLANEAAPVFVGLYMDDTGSLLYRD